MKSMSILLALFLVALSSCSSEASTCEELADEAIEILQELIDDVETELGDASLDELVDAQDLPSLAEYEQKGEKLDAQADELGCTESQISDLVAERGDQLQATTPVGNLIIDGITGGGL